MIAVCSLSSKIGKRAVYTKIDASYFPNSVYTNINYTHADVDEIGLSLNSSNVFSVPNGNYIVIARFTSSNHIQGNAFNLRAYVNGTGLYTAYSKALGTWDTKEICFSFEGNNFSIALYHENPNSVQNVAGRYTSVEVIRVG